MKTKKDKPIPTSTEQFLLFFSKGIIPFPGEDLPSLLKRFTYLESLLHNPETFFSTIPHRSFFSLGNKLPWFFGFYKARRLPFWIAALTWIVPTEHGFSVPCLQLSSTSSFLLPSREEIVNHESIHALRANFDEPRFEEILAYRTSKSRFRKFLGPLFQTTTESNIFIIISLFTLLATFFFTSSLPAFLPTFYLSFLSFRLFFRNKTLERCIRRLSPSYKNCEQLLLHLTDAEIELIAKKGSGIRKKNCLRWQQINALYSL